MRKKLINVSNRLPVTIGERIERSAGGLVSALSDLGAEVDLQWIGWAGGLITDSQEQDRLRQQLIDQYRFYPLFLEQAEAADYYEGFSNSTVWPLLHSMTPYSRFKVPWLEAYRRVNRIFAQAVMDAAQLGAMVWVHDYHLMLLPGLLRQLAPSLKIGFFFHTPFPPGEIFRCMPAREELLQGLLGADLIGFQTFGHLRHFRSALLSVLGLESEMDRIEHDRYITNLGVYPIGINAERFERETTSPAFARRLAEYSQAYGGKRVVLSVERLDYTKGILRRLDAIERFLGQKPWDEDIVFIFVSVPSREEVATYQDLVTQVQRRVSHINGKYATIKNIPLHFMFHAVKFSELCTLYALADVCMVTPLVDGMNLVAKEFIACQQEQVGMLILSEFAGAAQELPNALIVNPYDPQQMVDSLNAALSMSLEEKAQRMAPMRQRVLRNDARRWAMTFLDDLHKCKESFQLQDDIAEVSLTAVKELIEAPRAALFLDYDGTLSELRKNPVLAYPHAEIEELLSALAAAPGLDVYLISGRTRTDMQRWFGRYQLSLIAEHGVFLRPAGGDDWISYDTQMDLGWMEKIIETFNHYADMTPGSFVETKAASVVWHYREADREFGSWKANQLVTDLSFMISNLPAKIYHGKRIVEVSTMHVNKGVVVTWLMEHHGYGAALCAGDDETDENMLRCEDPNIISVKVGGGQTAARYRSADPKAFRAFLRELLRTRSHLVTDSQQEG